MTTSRQRLLKRFLERQNNTRGMGLARDVQAGQAYPVPTQAAKRAAARERAHKEWKKGWTRS